MISRFKEIKRQFSRCDSKSNKQREDIVEKLLSILTKPPSFQGYAADINSTLEEHSMTQKDYLKLILLCFSHQARSEEEALLIFGYLFYMQDFTSIITKNDSPYINETLQYIALNLEYEKVEAHTILMRFGEKGKKAYLILDGFVDILIKTSKKMMITQKDYFKYIANLLVYNEYGLVNIVLNDNYSLYPVLLKDLNNEMSSIIIQTKKGLESSSKPVEVSINDLLKLISFDLKEMKQLDKVANNVSCEEYIERLNVSTKFQNENHKKSKKLIELNIYSYVIIASQRTGELFGQLALSNSLALRTATIISKTQSHLAILYKSTYNLCLAAGEEKNRRNGILFVLSTKLFSQVSYDYMDKKFFNNFTNRKIEKGTLLIEENEKPKRICLLKEGVFEVSIKNSFKYLISLWKEFNDKIKDNQTEKCIILNLEKEYERKSQQDRSFCRYYNEKRKYKINYLQCPEVIGLRDYTNNDGLYVFTVECKSPKSELFEMTSDFYYDICHRDWSVKPNEKELLQNKYTSITFHLKTIIHSVMRTYKLHDKDVFTPIKKILDSRENTIVDQNSSKRLMRNTLIDIKPFQITNPENEYIKLDNQFRTELSFNQQRKTIQKSNTFNLMFAPIKQHLYTDPDINLMNEKTNIDHNPKKVSNHKVILRFNKSIQKEINQIKEKFNEYHTFYFATDTSNKSISESIHRKTIQKINLNKILFQTECKKQTKNWKMSNQYVFGDKEESNNNTRRRIEKTKPNSEK